MQRIAKIIQPKNYLLIIIVRLLLSALWVMPVCGAGSEFHVAPSGSPSGDGSLAAPWDLATALAHPAAVQPGDIIWLRDGTYTGIFNSYLTGDDDDPVIVRSYPDEWAVIDTQAQAGDGDNFRIYGSWTYYWGFELMNSRVSERSGGGFSFVGSSRNNKFINLIIHDIGNNSFRDGNEIYGSILYNNGLDGSILLHHLYIQNDDPGNPVRLVDSIIFNSYAFGVHAYAGNVGQLRGIHLIGNVWFNNGVAQTTGELKDNVLVGGVNGAESILLQENMGWANGPTQRSVKLGRYCDLNEDITLIDNYLVGDTSFYNVWQSVAMSGNTFHGFNSGGSVDPALYPDNTYLTTRPGGTRIFIRPNHYEAGRAHIVVYNWDLADTIEADVSSVLNNGDVYQVRNAQNYFASPVASGIYHGNLLTLPMTGLEPAQPIGSGLIESSEYTGPEFNVFVLIKIGTCCGCSPQTCLPLI